MTRVGVVGSEHVSQHGADPVAHAAQALRHATHALLEIRPDQPGLSSLAAEIHAIADTLETRTMSAEDRLGRMDMRDRAQRCSPVVGSRNALAPPLFLNVVAGGVEGTVVFGVAHEGRRGWVHEGVAAMILDVALADANISAGVRGVTAQLTLRFHHRMPLGEALTVRARHERVAGRKAFSRAAIWSADTLCVSAEGLFVAAREGTGGR
jgi:acyl-CoA thioesterase FadM